MGKKLNKYVISVFAVENVMESSEFKENSNVLKCIDITKQVLGVLQTHKGG